MTQLCSENASVVPQTSHGSHKNRAEAAMGMLLEDLGFCDSFAGLRFIPFLTVLLQYSSSLFAQPTEDSGILPVD